MTKNKESTRYYSSLQEEYVAKLLNGQNNKSSGSGHFRKGDVIINDASMLCECKTTMTDKDSFSIKKEWITKNNEERFAMRLDNSCIAFNFGPGQQNYFVINEKLMKYLVEKLREEYENDI